MFDSGIFGMSQLLFFGFLAVMFRENSRSAPDRPVRLSAIQFVVLMGFLSLFRIAPIGVTHWGLFQQTLSTVTLDAGIGEAEVGNFVVVAGEDKDQLRMVVAEPGETLRVVDGTLLVSSSEHGERRTPGLRFEPDCGPVTLAADEIGLVRAQVDGVFSCAALEVAATSQLRKRCVAVVYPLRRRGSCANIVGYFSPAS